MLSITISFSTLLTKKTNVYCKKVKKKKLISHSLFDLKRTDFELVSDLDKFSKYTYLWKCK